MPNNPLPEEEIFHKYAREKYFDYSKISQDIQKDFTERELEFSKEVRRWVIQLSVISSAIIGAIVTFGKETLSSNFFVLVALILLIVSVCWGLFHILNAIENQMIGLEQDHVNFQKTLDKLRDKFLLYFKEQNEENKNAIIAYEEILIDSFKKELKPVLEKDKVIKIIFVMFTVALLLLLFAIIDWGIVSKALTWLQNIK